MAWTDRVHDAVIETQAGDRFVFEFRDLEAKRDDNTNVFNFSNRKDYVQKTAKGSEIFPHTLYFSGTECDTMADAFELAIADNRPIIYTHPLRQTTYNVHVLSFVRNDNLVSSANEVAFSLLMHETQELDEVVAPENENRYIDNTNNEFIIYNAVAFKEQFSNKVADGIRKVKAGMNKAVAAVSKVAYAYEYATDILAELQGIALTAENLVNTIETSAESFASVQQGFISFSAKGLSSAKDRILFYDEMKEWIEGWMDDPDQDPLVVALNASAVLSGIVLASISADSSVYKTKTSVFEQSEKIFLFNEKITEYIENAESEGTYVDTPDQAEYREQLTRSAAGKLSQIAFKTKQERIYVLNRYAEMYSFVYSKTQSKTGAELDDNVDEFIRVNGLGGQDLYEIPKNRALRFYI